MALSKNGPEQKSYRSWQPPKIQANLEEEGGNPGGP